MNSPALGAAVASSDGLLRVALEGEIDLANEEDVVRTVAAAIAQFNPSQMVLDLRSVTFMDSSGLRAVLRCRRAAENEAVRFRICVVEGPVTRLLSVAGVAEWFERE